MALKVKRFKVPLTTEGLVDAALSVAEELSELGVERPEDAIDAIFTAASNGFGKRVVGGVVVEAKKDGADAIVVSIYFEEVEV